MCTVVANSTAVTDPGHARKLGNASIGLSITGIVVTAVIVTVVYVAVVAYASTICTYNSYSSTCPYECNGVCYRNRYYVGTDGYCYRLEVNNYCYY